MKVRQRMTHNPVAVSPKTNYNKAFRVMQENDIQHLPVVNEESKLVGIVTKSDMLMATPSRVTTLNAYEVASLLETVTMAQIMSQPVYAVEEDCSITAAAHFMQEKDISCLPVMRSNELRGILTEDDVFQAFIEITGGGQAGTRVQVKGPDEKGHLAKIVSAFSDAGSYIVSVAITYDDSGDFYFADIKERDGKEKELRSNLEAIEATEILEFRPSDGDQLLEYG